MMRTLVLRGCVSSALVFWTTSCTVQKESRGKLDLGVNPIQPELAQSAAFKDSIGSVAYVDGLGSLQVRGYGLVVGLGKNGSRDCPRPAREQLVQNIHKMHRFAGGPVGIKQISPEELIASLDTAVVLVRGEIPGGAVEGTAFDISVSALPGTQTKSLRGGRLYTAELEVFRESPGGASISGGSMAKASGPVLINPFSEAGATTVVSPLEGVVLGGGRATKARELQLVLVQPSYATAKTIQERINNRFSTGGRVADAISPGFVQLRVPKDFGDDVGHFLSVVRALYLKSDAQFDAVRARALADEIARPNAPHAMIAACFEGLGRTALPLLPELYAHDRDYVRFYSAVAGVRLGDHIAADALALLAREPTSPYRFQAIRALGKAHGMANAAHALHGLLADEDPRIVIAAYEALVERGDSAIESSRIADDNFYLDLVPGKHENMIYVKRHGSRRIALFGDDVRCTPPVHYAAADGSFTINAYPNDDGLTLVRVVPLTETVSPPVMASGNVKELVRLMGRDPEVDASDRITGLGLDYGAVIRALKHLCDEEAVNARFLLQQPNASELFGPAQREGRPESELGSLAIAQ